MRNLKNIFSRHAHPQGKPCGFRLRAHYNQVFVLPYPQSTTNINTLQYVLTLPPLYWITGGDISSNGAWIGIRNDQNTDEGRVWYRGVNQTIGEAMSLPPHSFLLESEPQGESFAWESDGLVFYNLCVKKTPWSLAKGMN